MARSSKPRSATPRSAPSPELQPRELLLAGLGAISLGRKQAIKSYSEGFVSLASLRSRAEVAVQEAVESVNSQVLNLRKQAKSKVTSAQKKVVALATEARVQSEIRLAPVLARFGVKAKKRKPAAKRAKATVKRTRKAA